MPDLRQLARNAARKYGVPESIYLSLIKHESGWNPRAGSPAGAVGLVQIHLPSHPDVTYEQATNPGFALDWGARYLASQYRRFGTWRLALAAYNAGPDAVEKYRGVPPFAETVRYVQNVLSTASSGKNLKPARSLAIAGKAQAGPPSELPSLDDFALKTLSSIASGTYDPQRSLADLAAGTRTTGQQSPVSLSPVAPSEPSGVQGQVNPALLSMARQYGLKITSGFRTPEENARVGGVPTSFHLKGQAMDFSVTSQAYKLADYARTNPSLFKEFFGPVPWAIKNGKFIRPIRGHEDHFHLVL